MAKQKKHGEERKPNLADTFAFVKRVKKVSGNLGVVKECKAGITIHDILTRADLVDKYIDELIGKDSPHFERTKKELLAFLLEKCSLSDKPGLADVIRDSPNETIEIIDINGKKTITGTISGKSRIGAKVYKGEVPRSIVKIDDVAMTCNTRLGIPQDPSIEGTYDEKKVLPSYRSREKRRIVRDAKTGARHRFKGPRTKTGTVSNKKGSQKGAGATGPGGLDDGPNKPV